MNLWKYFLPETQFVREIEVEGVHKENASLLIRLVYLKFLCPSYLFPLTFHFKLVDK